VANPHRPLTLLPAPQEIRVTVSPSEDRDGRPIQFSGGDGIDAGGTGRVGRVGRGRVHRVVHWVGPERIAGQWWEGHNKTRDYFDVEDETGRRYWIFRVQESGRWFLHGMFS
jgi:protein ImuB